MKDYSDPEKYAWGRGTHNELFSIIYRDADSSLGYRIATGGGFKSESLEPCTTFSPNDTDNSGNIIDSTGRIQTFGWTIIPRKEFYDMLLPTVLRKQK